MTIENNIIAVALHYKWKTFRLAPGLLPLVLLHQAYLHSPAFPTDLLYIVVTLQR